jgi:hypothetical protein
VILTKSQSTKWHSLNRNHWHSFTEKGGIVRTAVSSQFQGESETTKYPAICSGTYEVNGTNVEFANSCVWTAEFDWTLILSGEFSAELAPDELTLQRKNGSSWDLYQLKRQ